MVKAIFESRALRTRASGIPRADTRTNTAAATAGIADALSTPLGYRGE